MNRRELIAGSIALGVAGSLREARAGIFLLGGAAVSSTASASVDPYYSAQSFASDPFSAYTSFIFDPSFAGTDGTNSTISWNGGSLTAPTYKEVQNALTAAAGASQRLCIPAGVTFNVPASTVYTSPAGGSSDSARFVIQGDPAATSSTMPIFDMGSLTSSGYFNLCSANDTKWITFRKIRFQNATQSFNSFDPGTQQSIDGLIYEFCYFYNLVAPSGAADNGCVAFGPGCMWAQGNGPSIRYNYFDYATVSGYNPATQRENTAAITFVVSGTAGAYERYIHHNEFIQCGQGIYDKVAPYNTGGLPNPKHVAYNIFGECAIGVYNGGAGASQNPYINDQGYRNLFYSNGVGGYVQDSSTTSTPQCSGHTLYNNTFAEDVLNSENFAETTGIISYNNVCLSGSGNHLVMNDDASGSYSNSISFCDYNAYAVPGSTVLFETNHYGTPDYTYTAVTGSGGWDSAYTTDAPAQLSADPDVNSFNAIQGRAITTADFNATASRDYSPVAASALLTTGRGGSYPSFMGCYNKDSVAGSDLVGRGWT